jgi:uncharacterized protein (DUF58 family)
MAPRLLSRFRTAPHDRRTGRIVTGDEPLLDQELMASLQRLALSAPRVQRGTFAGEHRSKRRGASPEFADFKSYSPGDDIRRVDWNLYARFDELFVRLSEVTTDLTVHFLLDASASMDWRAGLQTPTKYRFAQKVAAALSYVALWHFDRIRISPVTAAEWPPFGPVQGRSQVPGLIAYLEDCRPGGDQSVTARLRTFARREPIPGLVIILSDVLTDDLGEMMAQCRTLRGKGWDIALIQIIDPAELEPELMFPGEDRSQPTTLIDSETGARVMVLPSAASLQRYSLAVIDWLDEIAAQCRTHGITYLRLASDQPVESAVLRLLNERGLLV